MEYERHAETAHPTDLYVGRRIKMRRRELGVSQEHLAQALGITFQQVQKYERAANRVSASKLYEIARALRVPVTYFFEGLPGERDADEDLAPAQEAFLLSQEGVQMARAFPALQPRCQRSLLQLLRAIAEAEQAAQS